VHGILQNTYAAFTQRLHTVKAGDSVVPLLGIQIEKLIEFIMELSEKIRKNEDLNGTLKKLAILGYSTSGNGYYLLQRGILTLSES